MRLAECDGMADPVFAVRVRHADAGITG